MVGFMGRGWGLLLAGLWLMACSPAFNWRLVGHEGVPARMLMPCKPERAEREVRLLGADSPSSSLRLMSCESGGHTFAWAALRLPPGLTPPEAAHGWMRASWVSLRQNVSPGDSHPVGWSSTEFTVEGGEWGQRWRGPALDHRQQPLQAQVLLAVSDGWLHQAAVYAPPASADASVIDTFFESLTLR
ncbi:hypothetical protein [Tepidicella baoligensis]|uniref:hypothetical protein n=1 Tax=Tepidicella baoligensis TaxID=2707016 RepID=UPI0015D97F7F|nr:hypothetical protein [Tepidicella baoligensis]